MLRAAFGRCSRVTLKSTQEFAALLRHHRLFAGLSQEALAERAGLSVRGISDMERGVRRVPHPATFARLVEALDLDVSARAALLLAARATAVSESSLASAVTKAAGTSTSTEQPVGLVERQQFLDRLDGFLADVLAGQGRLVLLGGEAGVGKSVLVQHFARANLHRARTRIGACDPLSTPTALGPLLDVAAELSQPLAGLLASAAPRKDVFDALQAALNEGEPPTVLVFEDVHWADEATLDLLRFFGRRMAAVPALLVATYRDDEVGPVHPLRVVLGDLAAFPAIRRLQLTPLSEKAVRELARDTDIDPEELYHQTGGNPFFVTEVLAAGTREVPPSVRDAVLARAARLPPHSRAVLEAAAVIGGRIEAWLLEAVARVTDGGIEACLAAGVLQAEGDFFTFRHELGRIAILDAMVSTRRLELHRQVLAALRSASVGPDDWARLAHHAEAAYDAESVVAFAPIAAKRAARLQAHREAAAQYARALRFADRLAPAQRAQLLEARAYECYLTDQNEAAIDCRRAALDIWQVAGERLKMADNLRWLSRLWWFIGRNAEAHAAAASSLEVIDGLPPGIQHAWVYSNQAQLCMLADDTEGACALGERAIALAEQLGDREVLAHALNNVGSARGLNGDSDGYVLLERSLQIALESEFEEHAARAFTNLSAIAARECRLDAAEKYLDAGLKYCAEHDLDSWLLYMSGWQSRVLLLRGRWSAASDVAFGMLRRPRLSAISRINALTVVGTVHSRRGDLDAQRIGRGARGGAADRRAAATRAGVRRACRSGLVRGGCRRRATGCACGLRVSRASQRPVAPGGAGVLALAAG